MLKLHKGEQLPLDKLHTPSSVELQTSQELGVFLQGDIYWILGGRLGARCFVTAGGALRISSVGSGAARLWCVSDRP